MNSATPVFRASATFSTVHATQNDNVTRDTSAREVRATSTCNCPLHLPQTRLVGWPFCLDHMPPNSSTNCMLHLKGASTSETTRLQEPCRRQQQLSAHCTYRAKLVTTDPRQ